MNGLPATYSPNPVVLILGTFPGQESLRKKEYYTDSRNCFWLILEKCLQISRTLSYGEKITRLKENGIVLWDVINSCERVTSGDKDIKKVVLNDLSAFFSSKKPLLILLNGKEAGRYGKNLFSRYASFPTVTIHLLPSTSNANSHQNVTEKIIFWRKYLVS